MINSFRGPYRFLSNFWLAEVILDGLTYPTVEHAYQAAKTISSTHRSQIQQASTPGKAKRLGKRVPLRPNWDEAKLPTMEQLLRQKFSVFSNLHLCQELLDTKPHVLVEGNTWNDRYWGQCPIGVGENHLGKLLMKIRDNGHIQRDISWAFYFL